MTGNASRSAPRHTRRAWGFALACLLLGPPVGAVLVMLLLPVLELATAPATALSRLSATAVLEHAGATLVLAIFSFLLGGLPALASAIWIGLRTYHRGRFGYLEGLAVALIATVVLAPVRLPETFDVRQWTLGMLAVPLALASALVVRAILGRWM